VTSGGPIADPDLLALAESVLADEGFKVEVLDGDLPVLLAEDRYFVVGVTATATISGLFAAEPFAESVLTERLADSDPGPKVWDTYLILLTQERAPDSNSETRKLYQVNYDLSRLRRVAHSGVPNSIPGVRSALRPFVRPVVLDEPALAADPFTALGNSLLSHGEDEGLVARAISAFKKGVSLGDIL